jgi:YD repeat-containing protein
MKRILAGLIVFKLGAGVAMAQLYPDVPITEARPELWGPFRLIPDPTPPVFPIDKFVKRTAEGMHEGQKWGPEVVTRTLDAAGRLLTVHTADRDVALTYDDKGRPRHRVDGYGGKASYTYDFTYDDKGRLIKLDDSGTDRPAQTAVQTWDAAGNLATRAETSGGKTTTYRFLRSKHGTLISIAIDGPDGKRTMLYEGEDDAKGNLVHVKSGGWMAGEDVRIVWDKAKHPIQVTTKQDRDKSVEVKKYTYDAAGRITAMNAETQSPEQLVTAVMFAKYDAAGRLISLHTSRHSGPPAAKGKPAPPHPGPDRSFSDVSDKTFTYDAKGRLTTDHEEVGGGGGGLGYNGKYDTTYEYDGKGRLTKLTHKENGYPPKDRTDTVTFSY